MSLSLNILPALPRQDFSHIVLPIDGSYTDNIELLSLIMNMYETRGNTQDEIINSYMGRSEDDDYTIYGETPDDAYGSKLGYITAKVFIDVIGMCKLNVFDAKAVFAFIKELPNDTKLFLYWH